VKERPILFKGDMVRAILEGRKTQTRRVVKPQPHDTYEIECGIYHPTVIDRHGEEDAGSPIFGAYSLDGEWGCKCLYGQPGDRLWVRETWGVGTRPHPVEGWVDGVEYRADEPYCDCIEDMPLHRVSDEIDLSKYDKLGWKPSIHMPRWACRIELEIVSVRVERLNDISEEDARAEGIADGGCTNCGEPEKSHPVTKTGQPWYPCEVAHTDFGDAFAGLWQSINGADSWSANPWVWVVEFKRVQP